MTSKRERAFTIVELLVVIAILGILMALLLLAIQSGREASRLRECQSHLRELSIAALHYEAAAKYLPPGILGAADAFTFENNYFEPASPFYWQRFQYTSSLGLILPYLELEDLWRRYDPIAFDVRRRLDELTDQQGHPRYTWFGLIPDFRFLAQESVSLFLCPSDEGRIEARVSVYGALQPVVSATKHSDGVSWINLHNFFPPLPYATTNYAGCAGAHSGGIHTNHHLRAFSGLMSSRNVVRLAKNTDGQSHTIMYGETLGEITNGTRSIRLSWLTGALARGRARVPFGQDPPQGNLLGDHENAFFYGFASLHASGVSFAFGDGHVDMLDRDINWHVMYGLCGIADGVSFYGN